jgi:hypothetical protein
MSEEFEYAVMMGLLGLGLFCLLMFIGFLVVLVY